MTTKDQIKKKFKKKYYLGKNKEDVQGKSGKCVPKEKHIGKRTTSFFKKISKTCKVSAKGTCTQGKASLQKKKRASESQL